jgi:hypothetical protein
MENMNLIDELDNLQKEYNQKLDNIKKKLIGQATPPQPQPIEIGKWYRNEFGSVFLVNSLSTKDWVKGIGINGDAIFEDDSMWCIQGAVLATNAEIKEVLVKMAIQKGFVKGARFKNMINDKQIVFINDGGAFMVNQSQLLIKTHGFNARSWYTIFMNGKWAEIVKEEEIKIGEYAVSFNEGFGYKFVTVNGVNYGIAFLKKLLNNMNMGQIQSLNVGCRGQYKVDKELLKKIIERAEAK